MKELIEALHERGIPCEEGEPTEHGGTIVLTVPWALDLLEILADARAYMDLTVHVYVEPDRVPDILEVLERTKPEWQS
jgi:hypothetical protein